MADLAEIERALAADWSRENLAVYGDFLQSIGDARGELIAIDLANGARERKHELILDWLGDDLATIVLHVGAIEHAFVHLGQRAPDMAAFALHELLAHPGGGYLRELTIEDSHSRMLDVYELLAADRRPWLARLCLPTVAPAHYPALERAIAAMPLLADLELPDASMIARMLQIRPSIRVSRPTS